MNGEVIHVKLRSAFMLTALVASLGASSCLAADNPPVEPPPREQAPRTLGSGALKKFEQGVRKFVLSNGLRVLIFRRPIAPVFIGQTWVRVGGVDETLGKTGAAHLLEHMAFKGTETVGTKDYAKEKVLLEQIEVLMDKLEPKDMKAAALTEAARASEVADAKKQLEEVYQKLSELWVDNEFSQIYERQGETGLNAATAKDYTYYTVNLPKVAFELWCRMESDRILFPVFRQFYKERDVVREERRMRSEDNPGGRLYEALLSTAYWSHPYSQPVVGWPKDVSALRKADTEEMYRSYYRPDNMVISLVGDLDPDQAIVLLEKYFGRIPAAKEPTPKVRAVEVPQLGEREVTVQFDAEPVLMLAYHKPTYPDPDDLKISVLHALLDGGRSSLLHRELVLKRQLALGVSTSEAPGDLYPSLFVVSAVPRSHVTNKQLADAIQEILDKLQTQQFSEKELASAKRRVRVGFLSQLGSNGGLAETLGEAELLFGDWKAPLKMFDQIDKTTAEDIANLSKKYLRPSNRTYAHLERRQ